MSGNDSQTWLHKANIAIDIVRRICWRWQGFMWSKIWSESIAQPHKLKKTIWHPKFKTLLKIYGDEFQNWDFFFHPQGDSGGPLVIERPDKRWELVGTVSNGIKCAARFLPGIYMRASYHRLWIDELIEASNSEWNPMWA